MKNATREKLKAFMRGASRVLDVGGRLHSPPPNLGRLHARVTKSDAAMMEGDWQAVGSDLRRVIEREQRRAS